MTNVKSKISFALILFVLLQIIFFKSAYADGMIHIYDPDMMFWELQDEDQQLCAINYENGIENMLLSVDVLDLYGEKAVWIFPVPAKPDKTSIDIIKGFPHLLGPDIMEEANDAVSDVFLTTSLFQFSPYLAFLYLAMGTFPLGGMLGSDEGLEEITVHEHIEKMGLTTELITTKDGNAFYNYLTDKGLDLPSSSKLILEEYMGEEYSFVVSWISDIEKFKQETATEEGISNTLGVSISFPTDKIYFPLKPTSVYKGQTVPILIYVIGHVTPEIYPEIKEESQVNYFFSKNYVVPDKLSSFFNGKTEIKGLKWTKIKISALSDYLTGDLWVSESTPDDVILAERIYNIFSPEKFGYVFIVIFGTILFILNSCLASMFAGMFAFKEDKPDKKKFALFGLWNFLTIIGFIMASLSLKTKKPKPKLEKQLKQQGIIVGDNRKILFIFLFIVFFIAMAFIFQIFLLTFSSIILI